MQLTPKERSLLKDLKDTEKLCVQKYTAYAASAHDEQLKSLCSELAGIERGHLALLTELESGGTPTLNGGGMSEPRFTATYTAATESKEKTEDAYFCADLLSTEKHASHLYDTCVFEFTSPDARTLLNGIQRTEQNHGKMIYDYMSQNGMYG